MSTSGQKVAKKVYRYLTEHPDLHDQSYWVSGDLEEAIQEAGYEGEDVAKVEPNVCGTTMCIAGAAVFLEEGPQGLSDYFVRGNEEDGIRHAGRLLGIHEEDANALFTTMSEEYALEMLKGIAEGDANWRWA